MLLRTQSIMVKGGAMLILLVLLFIALRYAAMKKDMKIFGVIGFGIIYTISGILVELTLLGDYAFIFGVCRNTSYVIMLVLMLRLMIGGNS